MNENRTTDTALSHRPAPDARPAERSNGETAVGTHTPGTWIATYFTRPDGEPIRTVEDVVETTAHSARQSERAALFGVILDDADEEDRSTVVCYTGNGPRAEFNARLMAAAPAMHWALRDLLQLAEALMRETGRAPVPDGAILQARTALTYAAVGFVAEGDEPSPHQNTAAGVSPSGTAQNQTQSNPAPDEESK